MSMPDVLGAVVAYLRGESDIATEVGARVYGDALPASLSGQTVPKSIAVRMAGSGFDQFDRTFVPIGSTLFEIRCYGPTALDAAQVYYAVQPAMRRLKRHYEGDCLIHAATPVSKGTSLREPDTRWFFVRATYSVLAAEEAAA